MINSCLGNATLGELGNLQNFTLNNLKKLDFGKWGTSRAPCSIPGFQPPNLPNFIIPSIPLLQGLPPFPSFCLLPPFPGLPSLSLPPIAIPIPPLPFLPPIPLPIPGFSLPRLPLLPAFDLGSLNFLCGLISIPLPVLDPFAGLNQLISQINNRLGVAMSALNNLTAFCKENGEVIANTEVPSPTTPSLSQPTNPTSPPASNINSGKASSPPSSKAVAAAANNTLVAPTDPASKWALFLANENVIPADPTIINQLAGLLTGLAKDVSATDLYNILKDNNIPSADDYAGFTCAHIFDCLESSEGNLNAFIQCMITKGFLCGDPQTIDAVFELLRDKDLTTITCLEIALLFNAAGIPFGCPGLTSLNISPIDVARAFYLRHTTAPLTPEKIVNVLIFTGIIKNVGNNTQTAIERLSPLPAIVTPTSIADALLGIVAGPAVGSLKAACIALTQGTKATQAIVQIDAARKAALLKSSTSSSPNIAFFQKLASLTLPQFKKILEEDNLFPLIFPLSLWELIPLLSIKFDVDDAAISELLENFEIPSLFFDLASLHTFITTTATANSSMAAAYSTLNLCERLQESDFNYTKLVETIARAIAKYNIEFPTLLSSNRNIGNALQQELGYNSLQIINTLSTTEFVNADELTFLLLATGCLEKNNKQTSLELQGISPYLGSNNPIKIAITSPSNLVGDINLDTLNITVKSKQVSTNGMLFSTYKVVEGGLSSLGSTIIIQPDDITQTVEITIIGINGFVPTFEAVESIDVQVEFATILNPNLLPIPNNYIAISF